MPSDMTAATLPGARFDPFHQLQRAQADLGRMLGSLTLYPPAEFPALNLWTNADGAIARLEMPGVASEALDITIRRDTVTVRGERPPEATDDSTVVLRQERWHGPFMRTIALPFRVDADKASARFEHGVVTLTLPRPDEDKPRQIKVTRS